MSWTVKCPLLVSPPKSKLVSSVFFKFIAFKLQHFCKLFHKSKRTIERHFILFPSFVVNKHLLQMCIEAELFDRQTLKVSTKVNTDGSNWSAILYTGRTLFLTVVLLLHVSVLQVQRRAGCRSSLLYEEMWTLDFAVIFHRHTHKKPYWCNTALPFCRRLLFLSSSTCTRGCVTVLLLLLPFRSWKSRSLGYLVEFHGKGSSWCHTEP